MRIAYSLAGANVTEQLVGVIRKNGAQFIGGGYTETDTSGTDGLSAASAVVEVVEGDYFEVYAFSNTAQMFPVSDATWFAIEDVTGDLPDVLEGSASFTSSELFTATAGLVRHASASLIASDTLTAAGLRTCRGSATFDLAAEATAWNSLGDRWSCQAGHPTMWSCR